MRPKTWYQGFMHEGLLDEAVALRRLWLRLCEPLDGFYIEFPKARVERAMRGVDEPTPSRVMGFPAVIVSDGYDRVRLRHTTKKQ